MLPRLGQPPLRTRLSPHWSLLRSSQVDFTGTDKPKPVIHRLLTSGAKAPAEPSSIRILLEAPDLAQ